MRRVLRADLLDFTADPGFALPNEATGVRWRPDHLVLIEDGRIHAVQPAAQAVPPGWQHVTQEDHGGRLLMPGFIDTHLHIESSLVTPHEFDRCVLPYGVTTVICDPHEIANVLGTEGIQFFLDSAEETIMDIRVQLSSCVPATHLETSGADLPIERLLPFRDHPKVIGLAEFMNFPGVIHKDPICMAKLEAFQDGHIDGHSPLLSGRDLNGYLSARIRTDHECTSAAEAMEKIRKGMHILVREGSVSKDLHALMPIITERLSPYLALCTDDRNPLDIALTFGHGTLTR